MYSTEIFYAAWSPPLYWIKNNIHGTIASSCWTLMLGAMPSRDLLSTIPPSTSKLKNLYICLSHGLQFTKHSRNLIVFWNEVGYFRRTMVQMYLQIKHEILTGMKKFHNGLHSPQSWILLIWEEMSNALYASRPRNIAELERVSWLQAMWKPLFFSNYRLEECPNFCTCHIHCLFILNL